MFKRKNIIPIILIFLLGFLVGSVVFREYSIQQYQKNLSGHRSELLEKIHAIDEILKDEYLYADKMDHNKMTEQAISAYVEQQDDPYTTYFPPKINSGFLNMLKGNQNFAGIGAVVNKKDSYILIEEVLKKAPSAKAGLLPLDRVLKIDGESVRDMDIDEAVSKMRGEEGTEVKLTVYREKGWKNKNKKDPKTNNIDTEQHIKEITITREIINLPSVYTKILTGEAMGVKNKQILYIQLILIGEETDSLLKQELAKLDPKDIDGVIIDVRGNGGGYMNIAVNIVSHFVEKGALVTRAEYANFPEEKYYTHNNPFATGKNIVVLVDEATASAGEIIALALQDLAGATLLGTKTFGKGSIQTLHEFSKDGSSLKYTVGKRYAPNGTNIDHEGITPDIQLDFDTQNYIVNDRDNQLQKAIELLSK
ncbi:MAG: hypothetical protein CR971_02755 [candidate division SR1 bacterium]|nr:MAG: hypothetical protein CR971_02755 [candidate division SR1 bacterium]